MTEVYIWCGIFIAATILVWFNHKCAVLEELEMLNMKEDIKQIKDKMKM